MLSGQVFRLGPGLNSPGAMKSFHLIVPTMKRFYNWGSVDFSWDSQEDVDLGGDRRLYPIGLPHVSVKVPHIYRCELIEVLDFMGFDSSTLDVQGTFKLWNSHPMANKFVLCDGNMRYVPTSQSQQNDNPYEELDVTFDYWDLRVFG